MRMHARSCNVPENCSEQCIALCCAVPQSEDSSQAFDCCGVLVFFTHFTYRCLQQIACGAGCKRFPHPLSAGEKGLHNATANVAQHTSTSPRLLPANVNVVVLDCIVEQHASILPQLQPAGIKCCSVQVQVQCDMQAFYLNLCQLI